MAVQLVGFAAIVVGAFLLAIWLGSVVLGAALLFVGEAVAPAPVAPKTKAKKS